MAIELPSLPSVISTVTETRSQLTFDQNDTARADHDLARGLVLTAETDCRQCFSRGCVQLLRVSPPSAVDEMYQSESFGWASQIG